MKFILSRYNHDMSWMKDYPDAEFVIYDRSDDGKPILEFQPERGVSIIKASNIGTDWYDRFTYIIDNYDNLPDVAIYAKANIFKYISKEEFDEIKDNKTFTPILTKNHKTYMPVCFYSEDGMYNEINNRWYLTAHPCKKESIEEELMVILGIDTKEYVKFAPGSGYIVPKENILKHSKAFYQKLRSYLDWNVYPGEGQVIERGMYYVWQ